MRLDRENKLLRSYPTPDLAKVGLELQTFIMGVIK